MKDKKSMKGKEEGQHSWLKGSEVFQPGTQNPERRTLNGERGTGNVERRTQNAIPTILMACIQPYWSCLQLGSQHLARQFTANGYQVHYFSAPVTPLHLARLKSTEVRKRYHNALRGPWVAPEDSINSYIPFSLIAPDGLPVLKEQMTTMNWHRTILPGPARYLKKHRLNKVHILYIDNLSYHFLLDFVQYDKCVFRVMDRHDGFPGWKGKTEAMARKIAKRADLTIYSAFGLKDYVLSLNPGKSLLVPNGVDFDFFRNMAASSKRHPLLTSIPDPIILYVGSLDSWLDYGLIHRAANQLPAVSFVFCGPCPDKRSIENMPPNVYFPGPVSRNDLPVILGSARAGIIPFDINKKMDLIHGVRPLKLLEYMAAGLPVICARWPEVERMNSPAWLHDNDEEFVAHINKAVSQTHNPDKYLPFARKNDWSGSFRLMMKTLEKL